MLLAFQPLVSQLALFLLACYLVLPTTILDVCPIAVRPVIISVISDATPGDTRPTIEPRPAITNVSTRPHNTLF